MGGSGVNARAGAQTPALFSSSIARHAQRPTRGARRAPRYGERMSKPKPTKRTLPAALRENRDRMKAGKPLQKGPAKK